MISGEKMIYYSPSKKKLIVFDIFQGKIIETWPQEIVTNVKFNYCMWLTYNLTTKKALFLYMTEKNIFQLEVFSKDGQRQILGNCECKPLNIACQEGNVLYFSHNIGKNLVINVASESGTFSLT